jgi:hypothetical protein
MLTYCALFYYALISYISPLFTITIWVLSMDMSHSFTISTSLEYIVEGVEMK